MCLPVGVHSQPATVCATGLEPLAGSLTAVSDRQCLSCVAGVTFKNEAGAGACRAVAVCPPGFFEAQAPTVASDRACLPCPGGAFK